VAEVQTALALFFFLSDHMSLTSSGNCHLCFKSTYLPKVKKCKCKNHWYKLYKSNILQGNMLISSQTETS
jgi:hypothetical protein